MKFLTFCANLLSQKWQQKGFSPEKGMKQTKPIKSSSDTVNRQFKGSFHYKTQFGALKRWNYSKKLSSDISDGFCIEMIRYWGVPCCMDCFIPSIHPSMHKHEHTGVTSLMGFQDGEIWEALAAFATFMPFLNRFFDGSICHLPMGAVPSKSLCFFSILRLLSKFGKCWTRLVSLNVHQPHAPSRLLFSFFLLLILFPLFLFLLLLLDVSFFAPFFMPICLLMGQKYTALAGTGITGSLKIKMPKLRQLVFF